MTLDPLHYDLEWAYCTIALGKTRLSSLSHLLTCLTLFDLKSVTECKPREVTDDIRACLRLNALVSMSAFYIQWLTKMFVFWLI
jgi:hypothetical protein